MNHDASDIPRSCLTELEPDDFVDVAVASGAKPFHGKMLRKWLYKSGVESYEGMTDLSRSLRRKLEERYSLFQLSLAAERRSNDGTVKYAFSLADGNIVETIVIPAKSRATACLSTQVGCAVGCLFCASGLKGFARNLTPGEMVEQFLLASRLSTRPVNNIVFMGAGEPLLNLKNLAAALRILNHPDCVGFGARRITVSTIGLPDKIRELAGMGLQVNLAVSLHAPSDEKRRAIVPAAKGVTIASILAAADDYRMKTTRDVTFEYVLLGGINDSREDAEELAAVLGRRKCTVNLIAWNQVEGIGFKPPAQGRVQTFLKTLQTRKIPVTIRRSRGRDIEAACGQLRLRMMARKD
jgi:23S rRNA (adenine2503-C2)-methyltransferase